LGSVLLFIFRNFLVDESRLLKRDDFGGDSKGEIPAMKKKSSFSLAIKDEALFDLVGKTDHRTLGIWARECARRVLPYFEKKHPKDLRPRCALDVLKAWTDTGVFTMAGIRGASLAAHAAARGTGEDDSARSAARAAGQAVATAHVRAHALAAANYALQAVHRSSPPSRADTAVSKERNWQRRRLGRLRTEEVKIGEKTPMKTEIHAPLTIDAYIASCPVEVRSQLRKLRAAIRRVAPRAEETISYRMPAFMLSGRPLVYFAAFKGHIGFFPTSAPILAFRKELAAYKTRKGTIQFPLDRPVPIDLVHTIVRFRVQEIEGRAGGSGARDRKGRSAG
jgi:uncharacterized protein YdhG (YjbR/CyaY superfamily)